MTKATILMVEGKKADRPSFAAQLQKKGFSVVVAPSGTEAIARLPESGPDLAVVNAASLGSTGVRICQSLRSHQEEHLPIVLILDAEKNVESSAADVIIHLPFTVQKLVNRIKPFLPNESENIIEAGPIRLDLEQRRVKCLSRHARLTPRLATLLHILLQHRGEVIEREELFKKVWDTNYTGDTRTLDVHISWLRRAIEMDPDHPRFLHTVRGVGYRLDV
ncbi:MAG: response regulator transcription factor [Anaerolineales bacterium]|nr:response regulator transcription factor [Anaerolineales bacterium]MCX7753953.1 response regulator transcription factor [Anaerolineales bacterium]MDW8277150.1 response regulator transcription factor [Anaerolineales bacterium]